MRKFLNSDIYFYAIIAGLFATNIVSIVQVKRLLKSIDIVIEHREDLATALEETIRQRNRLLQIVDDNRIELSEFDQVILDSMSAKLIEIQNKYNERDDNA